MSDVPRHQNQRDILNPKESAEFARFVAHASSELMGSQSELAERAGVSPGMISRVIAGKKQGGGRTLRGIAAATGISVEEILSGVGLEKLKARTRPGSDRVADEARIRATQALATLYNVDFETIAEIFEEIGTTLPLPHGCQATTWFDVGRSALELRRNGAALTRAHRT